MSFGYGLARIDSIARLIGIFGGCAAANPRMKMPGRLGGYEKMLDVFYLVRILKMSYAGCEL